MFMRLYYYNIIKDLQHTCTFFGSVKMTFYQTETERNTKKLPRVMEDKQWHHKNLVITMTQPKNSSNLQSDKFLEAMPIMN